jgi:hypothetical protein
MSPGAAEFAMGINPADALAKKLNTTLSAAPTLQHHPDLAHVAATMHGDTVQNAQNVFGLKVVHTVARAADHAVGELQKQHDSTILASRRNPEVHGLGVYNANTNKLDYSPQERTNFARQSPQESAMGPPKYNVAGVNGYEPQQPQAFSWGGLMHHIVNGLADVGKGVESFASNIPSYANEAGVLTGDAAYALDPRRGYQSIEGNLVNQLIGGNLEVLDLVAKGVHLPGWNNSVGAMIDNSHFYNTALAQAMRSMNDGANKLFGQEVPRFGSVVYHHPVQSLEMAYMPVQTMAVETARAIFDPNERKRVEKHGLIAAQHLVQVFGGSLAHLGRQVIYQYHKNGINGAINTLLPSIMAAVAVAATDGAGAPEAATLLDGSTIPTIAGDTGATLTDATASGEEQTLAARLHNAAEEFRAKAIQTVHNQLGNDVVRGMAPTDLTSEEIQKQLEDEFAKQIENSSLTDAQKSRLLNTQSESASQEFKTIADRITAMNERGMAGMRAGRSLFTPLSELARPLGAMIKAGLDAPTSGEMTAFGIAPNVANTDPISWAKTTHGESFGQSVAQALTGNKNSIVSGVLDGIIALAEPFPMAGRAAATEKGAADSLVVSSEELNKIFDGAQVPMSKSWYYHRAINSMFDKPAAWIAEQFPKLAPLAPDLAEARSAAEVHDILAEAADAAASTNPFRMPKLGLYGQMKQLRTSENAVARFVTRHLVQLPMTFNEEQAAITNRVIRLGDTRDIGAVSKLFTALGMRPSVRQMLIDELLKNPGDAAMWNRILENHLTDMYMGQIERVWGRSLDLFSVFGSMSKEEMNSMLETKTLPEWRIRQFTERLSKMEEYINGHEELYNKFRNESLNAVRRLVDGMGHATEEGAYAVDVIGNDLSPIIKTDVDGVERSFNAALGGNQRGEFYIPSVHEFAMELRKVMKFVIPTYKGSTSHLLKTLPYEIESLTKTVSSMSEKLDDKKIDLQTAVDEAHGRTRFENEYFMRSPEGVERARKIVDDLTVEPSFLENRMSQSVWEMTRDEWVARLGQLEDVINQANERSLEATLDQTRVAHRIVQLEREMRVSESLAEDEAKLVGARPYAELAAERASAMKQLGRLSEYKWTARETAALDEFNKLWPVEIIDGLEKMTFDEGHQLLVAYARTAGIDVSHAVETSSIPLSAREAAAIGSRIDRAMAENNVIAEQQALEDLQIKLNDAKRDLMAKQDLLATLQDPSVPKRIGYFGAQSVNGKLLHLLTFGDYVNKIVNNTIFKPLALFTPGWAMRVGMSEMALNTARLGPRKMLGGFLTSSVIERESKAMATAEKITEHLASRGIKNVTKAEALQVANFVRGMVVGLDETLLRAIGLEDYVKNAAYLAYLHEPWLPEAVNGAHTLPMSDMELMSKRSMPIIRKGEIRTKTVTLSNKFRLYSLNQEGFFMGWLRGAMTWAGDDLIMHPVASIYRDLVDRGFEGQMLHDMAVSEAKAHLDRLPENELQTFDRHLNSAPRWSPAYDEDPHTSWAKALIGSLEGTVRGVGTNESVFEGPLNRELLDDIVNKQVAPGVENFFNKYALDERGMLKPDTSFPQKTYGPVVNTGRSSFWERFMSMGHEKALRPIMETISRKPTFVVEFMEARARLEEGVKLGKWTADQADVMAQTKAAENMIKYIHNPLDKTSFEQQMRIAAPFYFAQNQAWRRMGRLLSANPGAFIQYVESMLAVQKWVSQVTTNNGISLFVFPASAMFGIPITGSVSSLMTVDPFAIGADTQSTMPSGPATTLLDMFAPKFGPVVTVPAHWLLENANLFQHMFGNKVGEKIDNVAKYATMGPIGENMPVWESFVPNTVMREFFQSVAFASNANSYGIDTQLMQAQMEAMRSVVYTDMHREYQQLLKKYPPDSSGHSQMASIMLNEWAAKRWMKNSPGYQALLNTSKSRALWLWGWKSLLGFLSPVSTGVGEFNPNLKKLVDSYSLPKSQGGKGLPFPKSVDQFYIDHPDATVETLYKTKSVYGNYIPETLPVYQMIQQHGDFLKKYPLAGLAVLSTDLGTKYYQPATTALLSAGLRERLMPQDFLDNFLVTLGNDIYYNQVKPLYNLMRQPVAEGGLGYKSSEAYNWEQNFIQNYGTNYNPTWLASYQAGSGAIVRQRALQQLREIVNPKTGVKGFNDTQTAENIRVVLDNLVPLLNNYLHEAKTGKNHMTYAAVKSWWDDTMVKLLKIAPDLNNAVTTVFGPLG